MYHVGVAGATCAPECNGGVCPTDEPQGASAKPVCALQDSRTGKRFCTLICSPHKDVNQCGAGASCKSLGFVGFCTYDDARVEDTNEEMFVTFYRSDITTAVDLGQVTVEA